MKQGRFFTVFFLLFSQTTFASVSPQACEMHFRASQKAAKFSLVCGVTAMVTSAAQRNRSTLLGEVLSVGLGAGAVFGSILMVQEGAEAQVGYERLRREYLDLLEEARVIYQDPTIEGGDAFERLVIAYGADAKDSEPRQAAAKALVQWDNVVSQYYGSGKGMTEDEFQNAVSLVLPQTKDDAMASAGFRYLLLVNGIKVQ